jgi:hypothetical protein
MIEFRGLLAISSLTDNLNVFLFQNRNQTLSNNRMISGERALIEKLYSVHERTVLL